MNRAIKFRAYHFGADYSVSPEMLYDDKPGDVLVWKIQGQDLSEVMQFTGQTVHNDQELYEGDICKVEGNIHFGWKQGWMRFKGNGVVIYLEDEMRYVFKVYVEGYGHQIVDFDKGLRQSYKIIGNQFQHPHLLEGS